MRLFAVKSIYHLLTATGSYLSQRRRIDDSRQHSCPGEEGGYSHTLPIRVCAAQRGRDFEAPDLERGIHFRGVF